MICHLLLELDKIFRQQSKKDTKFKYKTICNINYIGKDGDEYDDALLISWFLYKSAKHRAIDIMKDLLVLKDIKFDFRISSKLLVHAIIDCIFSMSVTTDIVEMIETLVTHPKINREVLNQRDEYSRTPLWYAINGISANSDSKFIKAVSILLKHGTCVSIPTYAKNDNKESVPILISYTSVGYQSDIDTDDYQSEEYKNGYYTPALHVCSLPDEYLELFRVLFNVNKEIIYI